MGQFGARLPEIAAKGPFSVVAGGASV